MINRDKKQIPSSKIQIPTSAEIRISGLAIFYKTHTCIRVCIKIYFIYTENSVFYFIKTRWHGQVMI